MVQADEYWNIIWHSWSPQHECGTMALLHNVGEVAQRTTELATNRTNSRHWRQRILELTQSSISLSSSNVSTIVVGIFLAHSRCLVSCVLFLCRPYSTRQVRGWSKQLLLRFDIASKMMSSRWDAIVAWQRLVIVPLGRGWTWRGVGPAFVLRHLEPHCRMCNTNRCVGAVGSGVWCFHPYIEHERLPDRPYHHPPSWFCRKRVWIVICTVCRKTWNVWVGKFKRFSDAGLNARRRLWCARFDVL